MRTLHVALTALAVIVLVGTGTVIALRVREAAQRQADLRHERRAFEDSYNMLMIFSDQRDLDMVLGEECEQVSWRSWAWYMTYGGGSGPPRWQPDCNVAWNQPPNSEFSLGPPSEFCHAPDTDTFVMAVVGDESIIAAVHKDENDLTLPKDAIVLVQVTDSGVHWQEPGDLRTDGTCTKAGANPRIGGSWGDFHVVFLDGEIWRLRAGTPTEHVLRFFTVEGAREFDRDAVLGAHRVE